MTEVQEEMKCPKCGGDMKEYVTHFKCRSTSCAFIYQSYFHRVKYQKGQNQYTEGSNRNSNSPTTQGSNL